MLEKIGTPGSSTISQPSPYVLSCLTNLLKRAQAEEIHYAELGVGVGATTLEVAKMMGGKGEIVLFDFEESVNELKADLNRLGYQNITACGNTHKYWDSYNWTLGKLIFNGLKEHFDLVYLDGAHTFVHDALAFFLLDRLLKPGGLIVFDDYSWAYSKTEYMKDVRDQYMTEEMIEAPQIKIFVDSLVKTHPDYEEVIKNVVYLKQARAGASDLQRRLQELEAENARLKAHQKQDTP
jgi:predicted O-methyltransferase YrrM